MKAALGSNRRVSIIALKRPDDEDTAQLARRQLAAAGANEAVLLSAHVQDGALRFSDKSSLPIAEITSKAYVGIIGCNTMVHVALPEGGVGLATGGAITYPQAARQIVDTAKSLLRSATLRDALENARADEMQRTVVVTEESVQSIAGVPCGPPECNIG